MILYAGGSFLRANDQHTSFIVSFNGTQWQPMAKNLEGSPQSCVHTLFEMGGQLYAGGNFTNKLSVLNVDGWAPVFDLDGPVYTAAAGGYYIGGSFTFTRGANTCHNICKFGMYRVIKTHG